MKNCLILLVIFGVNLGYAQLDTNFSKKKMPYFAPNLDVNTDINYNSNASKNNIYSFPDPSQPALPDSLNPLIANPKPSIYAGNYRNGNDIFNFAYTDIQEAIKVPTLAKHLHLVNPSLEEIIILDQYIHQFTYLESLTITSETIIDLPKNITSLKFLRVLILNGSQINLPESIHKMTFLEVIEIRGSKSLKSLPAKISELTHLRVLKVINTNLSSLADEITELPNLVELDLSFNPISKIPEKIGGLTKLVSLTINNTNIHEIPESIGEIRNLKYLIIKHNQLKKLPASIQKLANLKTINLYGNPIEALDESLAECSSLSKIVLDKTTEKSIKFDIRAIRKINPEIKISNREFPKPVKPPSRGNPNGFGDFWRYNDWHNWSWDNQHPAQNFINDINRY